MDTVVQTQPMSRQQFLDWAMRQELRHEFDGEKPVATQGGSINHNQILINIQGALRERLKGGGWRVLGPDTGVATTGQRVRYPDVVVSRAKLDGADLLVPEVVVVFEVVSPGNIRADRVIKVREYLGVPSIQAYAIVEQDFAGLTLLERRGDFWMATTLTAGDTLALAPLGVAIPMAEIYEETGLVTDVAADA